MNDIETAYQQALDYLYSFVDYSLTRNLRYSPDKFDLGRMRKLMERLGNPQQDYAIIHVAGTKGKGSVSALTASVLREAGYEVGFYTSPHLQDFSERIQVNGEAISHQELAQLVDEIKPHVAVIEQLTTFELTTALAFLYFRRRKVEVGVIEVGLGGRLDATNVVAPLVSVITSLSYDHMAVLGNTLSQIAREKAGIIKEGKPVVLAPQKDEARNAVEEIARDRHAPLTLIGRDYYFAAQSHSTEQQSMLVWSAQDQTLVDEYIESGGRSNWQPVRLTLPLLGYHQVENAATAYATLQVARANGLAINDEDIARGFSAVRWPGRFEFLRRNPPVVIDSAHNGDSALKLRLALDDYLPGLPIILVFGASEDKDIGSMFKELVPRVSCMIATQSEHPRAMEAGKLVALGHHYGIKATSVLPLETALDEALKLAGNVNGILVTGSIFVAAAARELWNRRQV